jgi:hypothetical protein
VWHRDAPWISALCAELDLSAEHIDGLFVLAATL